MDIIWNYHWVYCKILKGYLTQDNDTAFIIIVTIIIYHISVTRSKIILTFLILPQAVN